MNSLVRYILFFFIVFLNFIISGLVVFIVQLVLYCTITPFNKNLFTKINSYVFHILLCHIVFLVQWFSNSDIIVHANKKDLKYFGKEHTCLISNHAYEIDWIFLVAFAEYFDSLRNSKPYVKKTAQYIPTFGWSMYLSDNILLTRSIKEDKAIIQRKLSDIFNSTNSAWVFLFPEGTRFNESKQKDSVAIAQKKGLPILKHHLLPKPKGFLTSLPIFRNNIGAVYDIIFTVSPTEKNKPTFVNLLLGKKITSHVYIKRIPLEKVPEDEEGATKFLNDMFVKKDILQDNFFNTGDYFLKSGIPREEPFKLTKSYLALFYVSAGFFFATVPFLYYILQYLCSASFYNVLIIFVGGVWIVFFLFYNIININTVKENTR